MRDFENAFVDVYSPENCRPRETILTNYWRIMPINLFHNVECFGYIIQSKIEGKCCLFCTDTRKLPKISDHYFDCMLLECNYNYDKVIENAQNGKLTNDGYKNHMALEDLVQWLRVRECKPKHLVAIHLSNNGNIDKDLVLRELKPFGENIYIAKKGVKIEI